MSDDNFTLNDEFVQQHGLSEEQISAISEHITKEFVPTIKKNWAEQTNGGLEAMLDGVSKYAIDKTGVKIQRERGEKWGDFLNRLSDTKLESDKLALEEERKQLQEKLKNFKGDDEVKAQLQEFQSKNNELLKQVAELEKLKGYDEKYEQTYSELTKFKKDFAFNGAKPNFPESVNQFEADHYWNEFKSKIEEKYNIEVVDNKAIAIDKENEHRRIDLKELVNADESLKRLTEGRKQGGTGADPANPIEVDDLPFSLNKGMDSTQVSKLVQEHLVKKLGSTTHEDYTKEFATLYAKAKEALKQAA
jgi:hypothetical protein